MPYTEEQVKKLREGLKKISKEREDKKKELLERFPSGEAIRTWSLSELEYARFKELQQAVKALYGEYGQYRIIFEPAGGVGCGVSVWFEKTNTQHDLTDMESW
jgi:nitroreductase